MKLTILAATGGIGGHLLRQALDAGHDVTAVVRSPGRLDSFADRVRVMGADLAAPDAAVLEAAVAGADAVLSGLGARRQREAGVATTGTAAAVAAMKSTGCSRIVVVSAAPIGTVPSRARPNPPRCDPGDGFFMRHLGAPLTRTFLARHYADLAEMEDVVRDSGLEWTIARPPRLHDGAPTFAYRTALGQNVRGGFSISRADVAHAMLTCLDDPRTIRQVIAMAS